MTSPWIIWDKIPWEEVNDRISRKVVIRDRMMMVMYRFREFTEWPEEKHKAEQGGYIIKGRILLKLPDEQQEMQLDPGNGYLIESYKRHSWKCLDEEVVFIDIFSPPRIELMKHKYAPNVARP